MSVRPFFAILPQSLKSGDEVIIKGHCRPDAEDISVNFTLDQSPHPEHIAYHFKIKYEHNAIIQNYKTSNLWHQEEVMHTSQFNRYESTEFKLAFIFSSSRVQTYKIAENDYSKSYVCEFPLTLFLEDIQTVQLWGDVEKITEFTCRYA